MFCFGSVRNVNWCKMSFVFLYLFASLLKRCDCHRIENDVVGQYCRDSENVPVAWWYIYKPPAGVVNPSGQNYSYLTPDTDGRWVLSRVGITEDTMLRNTLMPNFKRSYMNRAGRAVIVFESRSGDSRSSARGVVMAGQDGGFLLTHTLPGFPRKFDSLPLFPFEELENGHLLACLSLDMNALNKVARAIKEITPNITFSYVPETLTTHLPSWDFGRPLPSTKPFRLRPSIYSLIKVNESLLGDKTVPLENQFQNTDSGPIEVLMLVRPPGVKSCIYSAFAARQLVMLNVYGQSKSSILTTMCSQGFGVRNIDTLCLKYKGPEGPGTGSAYYVPTNSTDFSWFAVSTAAHWQQRGAGPRQFWVCTSQLDKEDVAGEGGLLLCVQNYNVWVAFDNLKVTEPSCE